MKTHYAIQPPDLSSLCLAITEHAPLPMATVEGASHIVRYVNPAFCRLLDKPSEQLVGIPFCKMLPERDECVTLLDRVFRTGKPESHTEQEHSKPHPGFWSFTMWPVLADERPVGVMIQVTETAQFQEKTLAMNEALMLGSLRQHELTEAADSLNVQLQSEIAERKQVEEALHKAGALQRAIFNSANFSSIATDAKGVIQIFNVGAERMLGYAAAEVMNKITPADISDPQELIARAKALSVELATPITPGFEALVFKASRGIEDIYELTYIRKDGSRFSAVVSVTALRDAQDVIIGYLLIGTDNTARKLVEAEQKKLDQRLRDQQFYTRSLIESNIDALMTTDPSGIITDVNKQMEALTGCTRDELIGAPFKSHFTDPERAEAAIKLVLSEKKVTDYELTARARDGKQTVVSYNATTFYDRGRTLQGVFAAARDVTERKEDEAQLRFLMRELTHRSKNLLAVIQAMARQTARYAGSTESFLEKFNARLQALAASHDILFKEEWQSASLADLVRLQLGPYLDRRESQVSVEGPTVLLKPDAAQNLGYALHELATNAAKYGALSVPEGRVSIAWRWLPEADGNGVELDWVESGGPAVVKPAHRGFGSMVIEGNLARELDTQVDLAFRAEGVQCKILLPPGRLTAIR
jgi:PAS domain S-box-containing protein